jgi:hypothetical protein
MFISRPERAHGPEEGAAGETPASCQLFTVRADIRGVELAKVAVMARRSGTRWRGAVIGLVMLALSLVLAAVLGTSVNQQKAPGAAEVRDLFGIVLTVVASVVVPLLAWERRLRAVVAPTTASVARAKDVLAGLVEQQWRTEALLRSLDDPDPIPVRWRITGHEQVMNHSADLPAASAQVSGANEQIAALVGEFRRMRRHRLVVLGGPGAGKTTLAVQLLLGLLCPRHEDEPVPVLLSVAGWDTTACPRVHDWLAARLHHDYPALRAAELGPGMAETLAERGHILPILDGLDELPPAAQARVITALNRSLGGSDQLILTSRTTEFAHAVHEAREVLHSALVIEPEPLAPATAVDYLARCLPPRPGPVWERILTGLCATPAPQSGPIAALAQITTTPLGLWLLRAVYITPGTDPAPLLNADRFPDVAALRAHLFDRLIEALVATRDPSTDPADLFRPRRRHDPARVRRWLGYLAHHLSGTTADDGTVGTRAFAWWQLARDTHALTRRTARTLGLTFGLVYGVTTGLVLGLLEGLTKHTFRVPGGFVRGFVHNFMFGLEGGLIAGLAIGLMGTSWSRQSPGFADLRTRGRLRRLTNLRGAVLKTMLEAGLAVGLLAGLVEVLMEGPEARFRARVDAWLRIGPGFGLVFGLVGGLMYGLIRWAETPVQTEQASTPMSSWRADRALNMLRITTFALAAGLAFGLMNGLTYAPGQRPAGWITSVFLSMLVGVLAFGPTVGLWPGEYHASLAYLVATYRLARAGRLPRRLMPFLDDAHRLGLLHAVGPFYQFRHAELQDHLAATYRP